MPFPPRTGATPRNTHRPGTPAPTSLPAETSQRVAIPLPRTDPSSSVPRTFSVPPRVSVGSQETRQGQECAPRESGTLGCTTLPTPGLASPSRDAPRHPLPQKPPALGGRPGSRAFSCPPDTAGAQPRGLLPAPVPMVGPSWGDARQPLRGARGAFLHLPGPADVRPAWGLTDPVPGEPAPIEGRPCTCVPEMRVCWEDGVAQGTLLPASARQAPEVGSFLTCQLSSCGESGL